MDWIDYRERLGIDFFDNERGDFCSSLILNSLKDFLDSRKNSMDFMSFMDFDAVSDEEYKVFCTSTGTQYGDILKTPVEKIRLCIKEHKESFKLFVAYYMAFVNCLSDRDNGVKKAQLLEILDISFKQSKLKYSILKDDGLFFVFPKGAKELDDALVSEPLDWLQSYPQTHKAFIKALKSYSEGTDSTASDVADLFRKSLETFFQEFFGSTKSLENLKSEYGTYMKSKGVPAEISNNLETLQQAYTNFMNGYAKHHDKTSINVLEYIMYQTGNIIRLLITLSKEDE